MRLFRRPAEMRQSSHPTPPPMPPRFDVAEQPKGDQPNLTPATSRAPRAAQFWIAGYVLLAFSAPLAALWWRPLAGVYVDAAALVLLLALAVWSERSRKLAIAAAIFPLAVLVNLSLSLSGGAFAQTAALNDTLLLFALLYGYVFGLNESAHTSIAIRRYALAIPLMIVVGELLGALGFSMLRHAYDFRDMSLPLVAVSSVVFAIAEEIYFRGFLQRQAANVLHPAAAAVLAATLYAAASVGHGTPLPALFAIAAGAVLSGTYYFTQNLVLTIAANATMKLTYLGLLATFVLR